MPKRKPNPKPKVGSDYGQEKADFISSYYAKSFKFPYNPDPLVSGNNYSIYDEMRDDPQIKSTLSIKKDMIINTGWSVKCDDDTPNKETIEEFLTDMLEHIGENDDYGITFEDALIDILSSYDYGFSLTEPIFDINSNRKWIIKSLITRPPQTFNFHVDRHGKVEKITQNGLKGPIALKPRDFLHHVHQPEYGNPFGKSDLRSAFEAYKAKKYISRYYNIYLEKFASPFTVAKYPKGWSQDDIDRLNNVMKKLKNATHITMQEDISIDVKNNQGNAGSSFIEALDYYNMQIARSILVPDLLGLGGRQTGGGSYSLGQEQFKVFLQVIEKDRQSIARKITTGLVRPVVLANFGDINCWFQFNPPTDEKIVENAKAWSQAAASKIYEPTDEEINYFRAALGFPEGDVTRIEVEEPPVIDNKGEKKPEKKKEFTQHACKGDCSTKEFKLKRELNKFEKKLNFKQIEADLNRMDKQAEEILLKTTKPIISSLLNQITLSNKKITTLKAKNLKGMNRALKEYYAEVFELGQMDAQKAILPNTKKFGYKDVLPEDYAEVLQSETFKVVGDYSNKMTSKASSLLSQGLKNGASSGEIVSLIKEELKNDTEIWIATVVRTKTNEIYNESRKRFWETDDIAKEIVVAYQWSAVIDNRTSEVCRSLDGKIFNISEYTNVVKPPAHFNCRSLLVPITRFEDFKDDDEYLTGESRPTVESLQDKGGNLLKSRRFISKEEFLNLQTE